MSGTREICTMETGYDSQATDSDADMESSIDPLLTNFDDTLTALAPSARGMMNVFTVARRSSTPHPRLGSRAPKWSETEVISLLRQFHNGYHEYHPWEQKKIMSSIVLKGRSYSSIYQKLQRMVTDLRSNAISKQELEWIDSYTSRTLLCNVFPLPPSIRDWGKEPSMRRKRSRLHIKEHLEDETELPAKRGSSVLPIEDHPSSKDDVNRTLSSTTTQTVTTTKTVTATQTPAPISTATVRFPIPITLKSSSSSIPHTPVLLSTLSSPLSPNSATLHSPTNFSSPTFLPSSATVMLPPTTPSPLSSSSPQAPRQASTTPYSVLNQQQGEELLRKHRGLLVIMEARTAMLETCLSLNTIASMESITPEVRSMLHTSIKNLSQHRYDLARAVEQRQLGPY